MVITYRSSAFCIRQQEKETWFLQRGRLYDEVLRRSRKTSNTNNNREKKEITPLTKKERKFLQQQIDDDNDNENYCKV